MAFYEPTQWKTNDVITAEKMNKIEAQLAMLSGRVQGASLTPTGLKQILAKGATKDYFSVGDVIVIPWTDYSQTTPVPYQVPHVIVHIGEVVGSDNATHQDALWLMWQYAAPRTSTIQFDAPEKPVEIGEDDETSFLDKYSYYIKNGDNFEEQTVTVGEPIPAGTTYYHYEKDKVDQLSYGSNDWEQSAIRQWLNSTAGINGWWTGSGTAPEKLGTVPGFLSGYDSNWRSIFKQVKVPTAYYYKENGVTVVDTKITNDIFFLPSLEQMYGQQIFSGQSIKEGDCWGYWTQQISSENFPSPSNGAIGARQFLGIEYTRDPDKEKSSVAYRLRSCLISNTYTSRVWHCKSTGDFNSAAANVTQYRALPACVIY